MLIAYTVSLDLIRSLRPVVEQLAHYNAEAVKQVTDAANSITHNLGEGSRRSGRDVRRFFVMAHGSASEVRAALDVADAWGWKVDGRWVCYYHPGDISDAWANGHAGVSSDIYNGCYQLGANVINYGHTEYAKWLVAKGKK